MKITTKYSSEDQWAVPKTALVQIWKLHDRDLVISLANLGSTRTTDFLPFSALCPGGSLAGLEGSTRIQDIFRKTMGVGEQVP